MRIWRSETCAWMLGLLLVASVTSASADVVTEWNAIAAEIASKLPGPHPAVRTMAIVQVSVFEAVNAITGRYEPFRLTMAAGAGASADAAVAAATRTVLSTLVPTQQAAIEAVYQTALARIADGAAKTDGVAVGEQAATGVLALRADDGAVAPDTYRPHTTAGVYVPTTLPAVPHWGKRKPWVMSRADQFRPGPPPSLDSEVWARDYQEIKAVGSKTSAQRTPEQTVIARFWEATAPVIYWPVARSATAAPGRDASQNARLLAAVGMAMDDALIAVFDAKYAYNFWRPITAIRNGGHDGSEASVADPGWTPFIETPMHPEYPCAHCIVSAALGGVLEAEFAGRSLPRLTTTSPTAAGAERSWDSVGDFVQEVALARIFDGVHYRNSTQVGTAMGRQIGALAATSMPAAR